MKLLYDYREAAQLLSISAQALRHHVSRGTGPAIVRVGTRVLFAANDLETFVQKNRVVPVAPPTDQPRRRRGRPTVAEAMAREGAR